MLKFKKHLLHCRLPLLLQALAQVFDLQNKLVAASAPVEPPVRWIAHSGPGCIDIGAWAGWEAAQGWLGPCAGLVHGWVDWLEGLCLLIFELVQLLRLVASYWHAAGMLPYHCRPLQPSPSAPPPHAPRNPNFPALRLHCTCAGDATGGVTRLSERPFSEKLEALYKSRSYQLAVAVAETEQVRLFSTRCTCKCS